MSVKIDEDDISVVDYSKVLKMKSFIVLSSEIPLGTIQRAFIKDNKLYIFDSQPKIICFNILNGKIEFEISKMGKGPGEFLAIGDFLVDEKRSVLTIFCQKRKKLINYSSINGEFINEYSIDLMPMRIANIGGSNIFYNPFKLYTSDKYDYILLFSDTEKFSITSKVFTQDPIFSKYMYLYGDEFPFFYNGEELFFVKRFENIVYRITNESINPIYNIILPNSAPIKFWEIMPDSRERAQVDYSRRLMDVYHCGNTLYFRFIKQNRLISGFYDIRNNHVLSFGQIIYNDVTKKVPIVVPIKGVYENTFFAFVEPFLINDLKNKHIDLLPESLLNLNEIQNPILIFYEINR
jgi:hypothetical protein